MLLSTKARLEARLAQKETTLAALYEEEGNYDSIKSFELDTGEASHRVTKRSLTEIQKRFRTLEAEIELLHRRLNGSNAVRHITDRRG